MRERNKTTNIGLTADEGKRIRPLMKEKSRICRGCPASECTGCTYPEARDLLNELDDITEAE